MNALSPLDDGYNLWWIDLLVLPVTRWDENNGSIARRQYVDNALVSIASRNSSNWTWKLTVVWVQSGNFSTARKCPSSSQYLLSGQFSKTYPRMMLSSPLMSHLESNDAKGGLQSSSMANHIMTTSVDTHVAMPPRLRCRSCKSRFFASLTGVLMKNNAIHICVTDFIFFNNLCN